MNDSQREQTRRDAEARHEQYVHAMEATEQTPLDFTYWLLAELEQAERERDEANREAQAAFHARLAKVPALVEALRAIAEGNLGGDPWQADLRRVREFASDALTAVWEQE